MKRTILFILMVFCLPIIFAGSINAQEQKTIDINKRQIAYLESTFQEKMSDHNAKISNVKKAFDFDGNEYIIIEGDSNGYMIYSVNSAIIVEYSSQSKSPYLEYKRDLFYGGPTFYYVLENDKLKHTIINENFSKNESSSFKQSSVELNQALYEQRDKQVLAYINEGVVKKHSIGVQSNSANTIKNPEFFENLDDFGYMSGGVCGFIGLNMLIAYHDAHKNIGDEDIMDDNYWKNDDKTLLKSGEDSLTKYLYELDPKDGTTSVHIHNVSKQYMEERELSYNHTSRYKPFYTIATVTNAIDRNTPVEVFGSLGDPTEKQNVNHAVVVYKYKTYKNFLGIVYKADYTAHYGWHGYNSVVITGIIGGVYFFEHY